MVNFLSSLIAVSLLLTGCGSQGVTEPSKTKPTATTAPPIVSPAIPQKLRVTAKLIVNNTTILLEEANTQQEQQIGLMMRTSMPSNHGMAFNFNPPVPARFWMKNTLIPLDMLFVRAGKIKNIQANVPPCKADPCLNYGPDNGELIDRVIELNAGEAKKLGLKVGDSINFVQPKNFSVDW
jgi:uncharacterized protein